MEKLLDRDALSELIDVPPRTLDDWRHRGVGPAYVRIGRHVRYRPSDVETWLAGQVKTSPNAATA